MDIETNIKERRAHLAAILEPRGLVDEMCECGHWRSEHDDILVAVGHGRCLRCNCTKYRWVDKPVLKIGQEKRGLFQP